MRFKQFPGLKIIQMNRGDLYSFQEIINSNKCMIHILFFGDFRLMCSIMCLIVVVSYIFLWRTKYNNGNQYKQQHKIVNNNMLAAVKCSEVEDAKSKKKKN